MNEEELKAAWQQTNLQAILIPNLVEKIHQRVDQLDAKIKSRDRLEITIAISVIPFFGFLAWVFENPYTRTGCIIVIIASLWIIFVLRRYCKKKSKEGKTVKEQISTELTYIKKQRRLLQSVIYWYILPIYLGLVFFHVGLSSHWISFVVMMFFTTALMIFISHLNRKAVRTELDPVIESLETLLHNIDKE